MRSIFLDSWSMVWTISVCSSMESEMIERSSAYALTLWDAERVNLGVLNALHFYGRRVTTDRKEFPPFLLQSTSLRSTSSIIFSSPSFL